MANQKPKKTEKAAKKPSTKPSNPETNKETKEVKTELVSQNTKFSSKATKSDALLSGFFARKYEAGENILTIFKTPKIWGALIGELIGTMLLTMVLLTLASVAQTTTQVYVVFIALAGVYTVVAGLSGANLNPLVTAGMMATRRMSAIRGVLYMLAQVLGAWLGLIVLNAFRLGSEAVIELPIMDAVAGENFWAIALLELMGAIIVGFAFARLLCYIKKNVLAFSLGITGIISAVFFFGLLIAQAYFGLTLACMFNPAIALMFQILPTSAGGIGELAGLAGLALAAYVVVPIVGGIIGFCISDLATRLVGKGYSCECDNSHCCDAE